MMGTDLCASWNASGYSFSAEFSKATLCKTKSAGIQSGLSAKPNRQLIDVVDTRIDSDYLE